MKRFPLFSSERNRKGALIILAIIAILAGITLYQSSQNPELPVLADEPPRKQWKTFKPFPRESTYAKKKFPNNYKPYRKIELNTADSADFEQLPGIGPVLSAKIIKFREYLGGFRSKEELSELGGITPETLTRIDALVWADTSTEAFQTLQMGKQKDNPEQTLWYKWDSTGKYYISKRESWEKDTTKREFKVKIIDLNSADSLELLSLYGIGPKLAARIPKYREKLGFFHSLEQLKEIWGLSEENLEKILPQLKISEDFSQLPHLHINSISKEDLAKHPYIPWKKAHIIIAYRNEHGPFKHIKDLGKMHGIESEFWKRLEIYLVFD